MTDPNETHWAVPRRTGLAWISPLLGVGSLVALSAVISTQLETAPFVLLLGVAAIVVGCVALSMKWMPWALSVVGILFGAGALGLFIWGIVVFVNTPWPGW
jgi:hypothetical protein